MQLFKAAAMQKAEAIQRGRAKAEKLATCFEFELEGKFTMKKEIESVSPASFLLELR